MNLRQVRPGLGVIGIRLDGLLVEALRGDIAFAVKVTFLLPAAHEQVVGIEVFSRVFGNPNCFFGGQSQRQGGNDFTDDLVLQREYVAQLAIVALGPQMLAICRIDQLDGDAHGIARLADTALDDVTRTEFAPHVANIGAQALVRKGRVTRDDLDPGYPRNIGDQILGHAVGEILLLGIAAHVGERQHGDGRSCRCRVERGVGSGRGIAFPDQAVGDQSRNRQNEHQQGCHQGSGKA